MNPITTFKGKSVAIPIANIDTDQITPAVYLTGTEKKGLGKVLFRHWRCHPDGSVNPDFALNKPGAQGATILVAGDNYGCGSSREHAPWAMADFGLRAVVSTSMPSVAGNSPTSRILFRWWKRCLPESKTKTHKQSPECARRGF